MPSLAPDAAPDLAPDTVPERVSAGLDPGAMTLRARTAWPSVLAELHLARRYRAAQSGPAAGAPREPASPIGRLAGRAGGATRDASASQVATMWHLVQREDAWRIRQGFITELERWLEETTPGDSAIDWARARRAAERITQLAASDARLLALLSAELIEGAGWHSAAALTAEVSAPAEVRAAWIAREASERGMVGRPRREVTEAPVAVERLAWGEARLTGAVLAWGGV